MCPSLKMCKGISNYLSKVFLNVNVEILFQHLFLDLGEKCVGTALHFSTHKISQKYSVGV